MDHRHGLIVDVEVTEATGCAEREAALKLLDRHDARERRTVSADKTYDTAQFVAPCRERGITPQVAMNITDTADRRSMRAPHDMPATKPVSGCASGSRSASAGAKTAGSCAR